MSLDSKVVLSYVSGMLKLYLMEWLLALTTL